MRADFEAAGQNNSLQADHKSASVDGWNSTAGTIWVPGASQPATSPPVITGNTTKQVKILLFSPPSRLELSQRSPWCTSVSLPARSCCRTRSSPHTCLQPTAGHSVPHTHRRRSQPPPTCSKKLSHVRQERRWKTRQSGTQAVPEMATAASSTDQ